jgi:menaquinone-9 beta-reductase
VSSFNILLASRHRDADLSQKIGAITLLDDGPKFSFCLARPPSPACASPYFHGCNSDEPVMNPSDVLNRRLLPVRDGDAQHINRHEEYKIAAQPSMSQINRNAKQNKHHLWPIWIAFPAVLPCIQQATNCIFVKVACQKLRQPFDNRVSKLALRLSYPAANCSEQANGNAPWVMKVEDLSVKAKTDVFVVGGGPAGLAAAIAAREKGLDVTVADGAAPPIDKPCGEGLMPDALGALRELGIVLPATEGQALRGIRFYDSETCAGASFPNASGIGLRRTVLHQKMIERALNAGVQLLWRTPVIGIVPDGVLLGGEKFSARWIVGADGMHSRVRQWIGFASQPQRKRRYAFRRHYHITPWSDCAEVYWGSGMQAYVTPVGAEEVCVVLISRHADLRFTGLPSAFPELGSRLACARASNGERGAITAGHQLSRVYRDNVALLGDASGSVDAITGEGLCLSFRQALALADALSTGNLRQYQHAHRRLARRPFAMGKLLLLLGKTPAIRRRVLRSLAAHPDLFARLLAVHVGSTSPAHLAGTGALLAWRFVII